MKRYLQHFDMLNALQYMKLEIPHFLKRESLRDVKTPFRMGLIVISFILISCSDRERANPFDPDNPDTKGAPTGVSVISNYDTITVRWNAIDVDDFSYYQIYRSIGKDTMDGYDSTETNIFIDTGINFDSCYCYSIQANTKYDEGTISDSVCIVPGPVNFWIADFYDFSLWRISYDGAHILGSAYFTSPIAVESDPQRNQFWVADYWGERLYAVDKNLTVSSTINLNAQPTDMAVNSTDWEIYVLLKQENLLKTYSTSGFELESISLPFKVSFYTSVAYDSIGENIWMVDKEADTIFQYPLIQPDSAFTSYSGFDNPGKIYSDPISGGCWAASDSGIIRIHGADSIDTYKNDYCIKDISINPVNGDCYYTGYQQDAGWETGLLVASLNYQEEDVVLGDDYPNLNRIQVVPGDGNQGFIVVQLYTWRILRFNAGGSLIGELGPFNGRLDFALE